MSRKYHTPKTPQSFSLPTLVTEIIYTHIQREHGIPMMTDMMNRAKKLGIVKTPKAFRKWAVTETLQLVTTLDKWLKTKIPEA
jgi:hypothetical protein